MIKKFLITSSALLASAAFAAPSVTLSTPSKVKPDGEVPLLISSEGFQNNCFTRATISVEINGSSQQLISGGPGGCVETATISFSVSYIKGKTPWNIGDTANFSVIAKNEDTSETASAIATTLLSNDPVHTPKATISVDKNSFFFNDNKKVMATITPTNPAQSCITKIVYYPYGGAVRDPIVKNYSATACADKKELEFTYDRTGTFLFSVYLFDSQGNSCSTGYEDQGCGITPKITIGEMIHSDSFEAK